jgi:pyridoxal phosphate enzyme (YggS family)
MSTIRENIQTVYSRIADACNRAGRSAEEVTLVAVTKTVGVDRIREALDAGVTQLGENRVQDATPKIDTLYDRTDLTWHMIGHLQTNKVKRAVEYFQMIHSVDNLKRVREIDKRAHEQGKVMPVLFEVNVSGEASKFGLSPEELPDVIKVSAQYDGLILKGLMTMAPFVDDPEDTRPYFRKLRELLITFQDQGFSQMTELSMGMTNDFEVAVEEGATLIRVGSAIFGAR